jgi:xanthine dehydrogenase accessory factor
MRLHPQLKALHSRLVELIERGERAALATIIESYGSTPQTPGFSALFTAPGLERGTLGGGILEKDAETRAAEALASRDSILYEFTLEADMAALEGAICGGGVRILIDADPARNLPAFQSLVRSLGRRRPGALATAIVREGDQIRVDRLWVPSGSERSIDTQPYAGFRDAIAESLSLREPRLVAAPQHGTPAGPAREELFIEPVSPLPRLVIAGAGHIGAAVTHLGSRLEFEVTVIDDRPEFANPDNLPDADRIIVDDIGRAVGSLDVDPDTYVVIVTRGHRHDGEALRACIASDAAYLGMIGSRNKVALMRDRFIEQGWATAEQWDRVHTPIGLEIHSQTVEEIAVSIAAQLVLERGRAARKSTKP